MEYVNFGNSGVKVSRMAVGLGLRDQHDEAGAERLIQRAIERGINLFDCANVYGLGDDRAFIGKSEEILGRALKGKRDDVVITSKVVSPIGSGPSLRPMRRSWDTCRRRSCGGCTPTRTRWSRPATRTSG